jgi:hypothetical protein
LDRRVASQEATFFFATGNHLRMNTDVAQSPTILAFPKGPDAWRIDWFGNVAFPLETV